MKTDMEVLPGVLVIRTEDGMLKAVVDVETGVLIHLDHIDVPLPRVCQFLTKVKSRYQKYLNTQALENF